MTGAMPSIDKLSALDSCHLLPPNGWETDDCFDIYDAAKIGVQKQISYNKNVVEAWKDIVFIVLTH